MTRKQILLKHLGCIHLSDATMYVIIRAIKEIEDGFKLNIDWKLLEKQKESLETAMLHFKSTSKYENVNEDPFILNLNGILELIDNLQDANCKE